MSQTLKRILIACSALAVIAVVAAGIYALTLRKAPDSGQNNTNTSNGNLPFGNLNVNSTVNTNESVPTNTNEAPQTNGNTNTATPVSNDDEASILRLARIFAERYGTFSNRNNFENITALEPFMTAAFQKSSAEYITKQQGKGVPQEFYGITTTVAALEIQDYVQAKSATVRIATRRVETKGNQDPTISTQYIRINFQNVSGSWKVSGASWE